MHFAYFAANTASSSSALPQILLIVAFIAIFYLVLMRPMRRRQQQAQQQAQQMRNNLGQGDQIVTIGGLYGTVLRTDEDSVYLEIAPGVEARYDRNAIAKIVTLKAEESETDTDDETDPAPDPADTIIERND